MKKKLKIIVLFMIIFIPFLVNAEENYVNYYGIEINDEEYENLLGLGFNEFEIYHMELDEFNANKDIDSNLESVNDKYYVETVTYDVLGRVTHTNVREVSEEEYNDENGIMLISSAYTETTYKRLTTSISKAGNYYRYKVTLAWKIMPATRSYDIIGIGLQSGLVYRYSAVHFNQTYCVSSDCTNTSTYYHVGLDSTGAGVSFKLPSGSDITTLASAFYYDVGKKDPNYTITAMSADGDYSHATRSISGSQTIDSFYTNLSGINLSSTIEDYYDEIGDVSTCWTGSW